MKINLYSNGSCENHGCEAIYLSLLDIFETQLTAYTEFYSKDYPLIGHKINLIDIYENNYYLLDELIYKIKYKLFKNDKIYYDFKYKPFFRTFNTENELFLSVGGDNYCYGNNEWLKSLNEGIMQKNKIILTGCSIEPDSLNEDMVSTLNKFNKIIARESITYDALKNKGLSNIYLKPDPAFILPTSNIDLSDELGENEYIGMNISPLILNKKNGKLILKNIYECIDYILNNTTNNVLLVPHVMIENNDDYQCMLPIYKKYEDTQRVKLIKNNNACEIKKFISHCKIFIAARTHASIAAYSNCIPTLVIGYSIKSRGIAKDLFGSYDNYVLSSDDITENNDLLNHYKYIETNYNNIKNHLLEFIPTYRNQCYEIKEIIEENNE